MKRYSLFFVLLVASAFTFPPADVKLEYSFRVGDEYTMVQSTKQTIKQTIMGMDQVAENAMSGNVKYKVVAVTATGAKLETQFTQMKNTTKSVMGEMVMDSQGEEQTVQNKLFKSMMNKVFYVILNKRGFVEDIENSENLWSGMKDLGLDAEKEAEVKKSMEQMMGKNSLKNSFEQAMVYYSDKKVKQGDTWVSKNGFPMEFPIQADNTWSLVSLAGADAKVNSDGVFSTIDKNKKVTLPGGFEAKVDLSGKQNTKASVNAKSGWPSNLAISSTLKGTMTLLAGGMIPQDMDVPMEILTETTYTITKK
ncbi:DUF6263 family protein [Chryseolinea lacunae]|uniref:DUF4412 domain-containing protein n=1 Tax=Chryseolinea lacunae TaxID=2801331 RepID=A0ABS1KQT9_9BACT|nr:DUF6263 family protein [Chryseolinea lacunae]MBL0741819.1 hypothetical protein [Chryseolinea lacunae]